MKQTKKWEWYLPAEDLSTIYKELGYNVTSQDISKVKDDEKRTKERKKLTRGKHGTQTVQRIVVCRSPQRESWWFPLVSMGRRQIHFSDGQGEKNLQSILRREEIERREKREERRDREKRSREEIERRN